MSDDPDDKIKVGWGGRGPLGLAKPQDLTPTFHLRNVHLRYREVPRGDQRFFIVTRPDGTVQRFRQNPETGHEELVDSIPGGDPPD